ncbi:MAG: endonuclease/exonuclease/phosphatase family protein, partial [Oscillospiraceae bacterium]
MNKTDELEIYINEESPDIIGLTESWANENINDSEINFKGYTLFRNDRKNKVGGGVLLYVKNELASIRQEDVENDINETVWCEIVIENEKTLIGVCYRSPTSTVVEDLEIFKMIEKMSNKNAFLMGDFNYGNINWDNHEAVGQGGLFLDCVNDNFLSQHVRQPTRGKNILDLVLSTEENLVEELEIGEPFGTSDHQIIRWKIIVSKDQSNTNRDKNYNYFKANYESIREESNEINWEAEMLNKNAEIQWEFIKTSLEKLKCKFIPLKRKSKGKCKWTTRETTRWWRAKVKA